MRRSETLAIKVYLFEMLLLRNLVRERNWYHQVNRPKLGFKFIHLSYSTSTKVDVTVITLHERSVWSYDM